MQFLRNEFAPQSEGAVDSIAVFGGGLSAIFAVYKMMETTRLSGKKLDIILGAKEINTPCSAGNHTLRSIEGMFEGPRDDMGRLTRLLKSGLGDLRTTIRMKDIDCRLQQGYEIKGATETDLRRIVNYANANGIFAPNEISDNSGSQRFLFPGYDHSVAVDGQGQLNMPELLLAILSEIEEMGGRVRIGMEYLSHERKNGKYLIHTTQGDLISTLKPLLATGAEHQSQLPNFPFEAGVSYTMAFVMGPLAEDHARMIAPQGPAPFCTSELDGDFIWGGIDQKNCFTLGCGDIYHPTEQDRAGLEIKIRNLIETRYPGLLEQYPPKITFGPMLVTQNKMPIIGRMPDYDIIGGWAGMGIVAGWTAATAYADWIINQDDEDLAFFESLQPGFASTRKAQLVPERRI